MSVRIEPGDMLDVIPRLVAEGVVADAIVTDPPYGLEFMGKEWDAPWKYGMRPYGMTDTKGRAAAPSFVSSRNPVCQRCHKHKRGAKGCRCPLPEFDETTNRLCDLRVFQSWSQAWALAAFDVLRPGGFLVVFGGTRTQHRMVCAIEDAGFVIQDTIAWVYGSGFPKHKSQLKPAFEPICLAYKPGGKRALQVDECRIETGDQLGGGGNTTPMSEGWDRPYRHDPQAIEFNKHRTAERIAKAESLGRWPANLIHDGSDEVLAAFPNAPGQLYAVGPRRDFQPRGSRPGGFGNVGADKGDPMPNGPLYGDTGTAARFFYCAKADVQDRWGSRHPTVKPVELIRYLVKLVCPPGGLFIDPFAGSGTTGVAALAEGRDAILIEREPDYIADIRERMAHYSGDGQHSLVAKARRAPQKPLEGLFAEPIHPPLTEAEALRDCHDSYYAAVAEMRRRLLAGEALPPALTPRRIGEAGAP